MSEMDMDKPVNHPVHDYRATRAQQEEHNYRIARELEGLSMNAIRERQGYSDVEVAEDGIVGSLNSLIDQLGKTHSLFNEFAQRIDPILLPEIDGPMNGVNEKALAVPIKSDLLQTIDTLHARVRSLQHRIGEVSERVQL